MAPPLRNKNAFRHGLKAIGMLPKDCEWVHRRLVAFRGVLEDEVTATHGRIGLVHGAIIQTTLRWEMVAVLAQRWLREANDTLSPTEKLAFARQIAMASDSRDRALGRLDLNRDKAAEISAFYAPSAAIVGPGGDGDPKHLDDDSNAPAGAMGAQNES